MSWAHEIFRAGFVAFGAAKVFSNGTYLLKTNGHCLARRQHGELPENVTDRQIAVKIACMFLSGILFLFCGLFSYLTHSFQSAASLFVLALFAVYAVVESLYYKYWRTFCFAGLSILILMIFLLVR